LAITRIGLHRSQSDRTPYNSISRATHALHRIALHRIVVFFFQSSKDLLEESRVFLLADVLEPFLKRRLSQAGLPVIDIATHQGIGGVSNPVNSKLQRAVSRH
jgi:hypothetical protein